MELKFFGELVFLELVFRRIRVFRKVVVGKKIAVETIRTVEMVGKLF